MTYDQDFKAKMEVSVKWLLLLSILVLNMIKLQVKTFK